MVIVAVVVIVVVGLGSGGDGGTSDGTTASIGDGQTTSSWPRYLEVGESCEHSGQKVTVVTAFLTYYYEWGDEPYTETSSTGQVFLIIEVEVKNTGTDSMYVTEGAFSVSDSDDYKYDPGWIWGEDEFPWLQELYPGNRAKGQIMFEVPEHATGLEIVYDMATIWEQPRLAIWQPEDLTAAPMPKAQVEILSNSQECDFAWDYYDCHVTGVVENTGNRDASWVDIEVKWYDDNDVLIDTGIDYISDLEAGESASFDVWYYDEEYPYHYEIEVTWQD